VKSGSTGGLFEIAAPHFVNWSDGDMSMALSLETSTPSSHARRASRVPPGDGPDDHSRRGALQIRIRSRRGQEECDRRVLVRISAFRVLRCSSQVRWYRCTGERKDVAMCLRPTARAVLPGARAAHQTRSAPPAPVRRRMCVPACGPIESIRISIHRNGGLATRNAGRSSGRGVRNRSATPECGASPDHRHPAPSQQARPPHLAIRGRRA